MEGDKQLVSSSILPGTDAIFQAEMCQRVGRTDRITDRMIDRMTDTSSCITAVFFSSYKLPKTVTVTMLWLLFYSYFGPVTLLCGTFLFVLLSEGSL